MTLPTGVVRRMPQGHGLVALFTADDRGDERQGLIRVPVELIHSKQHSEERRRFESLVRAHIKTWGEWLAKKGWILNSIPKLQGPFDPPSRDARSSQLDEGQKWYFATAYFKRETPIYLPWEAERWFADEAAKYREPIQQPASVDSQDGHTVMEIINPERVDPLAFAAERRARLGITPDDWTQQPLDPEQGRDVQVV